jgi:trehalose/maltose hydrolase-like predicted phosphorylase
MPTIDMNGPGPMEDALQPTADSDWVLSVDGYDRLRETSIESRFAISNGFLGVRGARSTTRGARPPAPARTYIAGLFDMADPKKAMLGLAPAVGWVPTRILLPDGPLVYHPGEVSSRRITLDMKRGALLTAGHFTESPELSLQVHTLRIVSLADRGIGLQLIQLEIEHGDIDLTFEASFEGVDSGLATELIGEGLGVWHTRHSGKGLAMATALSLQVDGEDLPPTPLSDLACSWTWRARPGQFACFQRLVGFVRSDVRTPGLGGQARGKVGLAQQIGWRGMVAAHEAAWASRWRSSDIAIGGDPKAQVAARFALYHLNSAANPADERVSIGARALTGDDYHGHVFWDTEIFLLPFYTLTWPEAARTLLMYRFHTLDAARAKAAAMGWRGALYAWESADTGAEMTPDQVIAPDNKVIDVLCGKLEQHISADIAYAIWQYWQVTGDDTFLVDAGAEILLETGRFWASRAVLEADGHHHIRDVIGPDEYHEHIDDNAYTNVMARWNIRRALDVVALLRERWPARWDSLSKNLRLEDAELKQWRSACETIVTGLDAKTGLFEQFSGYFDLEDIDLANYAGRTMPMDVVLGRPRIQNSRVVKQSDVVALLALLPEEFGSDGAEKNFRYYEPRCGHGSSLSPAMHGMVAARLGDVEMALRFFRQAAEIDLGQSHVGTSGGVHIAALGGIWMLVVLGFAGLLPHSDGIALDPHLPNAWGSLAFGVQWRGRDLRISIDRNKSLIEAALEAGEPMMITISGETREVRQGHPLRIATKGS